MAEKATAISVAVLTPQLRTPPKYFMPQGCCRIADEKIAAAFSALLQSAPQLANTCRALVLSGNVSNHLVASSCVMKRLLSLIQILLTRTGLIPSCAAMDAYVAPDLRRFAISASRSPMEAFGGCCIWSDFSKRKLGGPHGRS